MEAKLLHVFEDPASPSGAAVNDDGTVLVVSDAEGCCCYVYSITQGKLIQTIGKEGSEDGQLKAPRGVAIDKEDLIYVADFGNHRVCIFSLADGSFVRSLSNDKLPSPSGIAVSDKYIFVSDPSRSHFIAFSRADESITRVIGVRGAGNGQVLKPEGIAVDGDGNIVVADMGNNRVQIIAASGRHLRSFGSEGFLQNQFKKPQAVSVEVTPAKSCAMIAVSDYNNHRVVIYSDDGRDIVCTLGRRGDEPGELRYPLGVAFFPKGMAVTDSGNRRVQLFSLE